MKPVLLRVQNRPEAETRAINLHRADGREHRQRRRQKLGISHLIEVTGVPSIAFLAMAPLSVGAEPDASRWIVGPLAQHGATGSSALPAADL